MSYTVNDPSFENLTALPRVRIVTMETIRIERGILLIVFLKGKFQTLQFRTGNEKKRGLFKKDTRKRVSNNKTQYDSLRWIFFFNSDTLIFTLKRDSRKERYNPM